LGQLMIKEISSLAHSLGLEKLVAELPEMNAPAISAFNKVGFHRVAFLPNFVKDRENRPVDLVVMVKDIKPAHDEDYDYEF
jgi:ribosomal protein S18 acetylase RimI-like enzyme